MNCARQARLVQEAVAILVERNWGLLY